MGVYYILESIGIHTNLQLYSLKQAAIYWNSLINEVDCSGEGAIPDLKERLVLILSCLGLSLTQLVGQNWPLPDREKTKSPAELLGLILKCSGLDRGEKARLNKGFSDLLRYYGATRHFGENKDQSNYQQLDELSLKKIWQFVKLTLDIWNAVINIQRGKDVNNLDEWDTVRSKIHFIDWAEQ